MLYCSPAPVGDVMVIVPVGVVQLGCVIVPVGADGNGFTVTVTSFVIGQPVTVLLVTV